MALSLEQLTAAFKKQDTSESRPSNYYRFWDMKVDERAVVRFLPDANQENPFGFMVEKLMHSLEINGEHKTVPCLKMYGEDCPICKVSSAYYKDEGKGSVNGKKYWRKKQHIVQALVIEDPIAPNAETGENSEGKIMFINLSYQIYSVIKAAFESGDLDNIPFNFDGGYDFIIKKTQAGDHAKYDVGSNFVRRSSDLTPDEVALAEDESVDLSTLLPSNPGLEKVESMLEAALTGAAYEDGSAQASTPQQEASTPQQEASVPVAESATAAEEPAAEFNDESQDILAMIRNRKNKSAE